MIYLLFPFLCPLGFSPECTSYAAINDQSRKVTHPLAADDSNLKCDSGLVTQWYRFTTPLSTQIPETCVSKRFCGTHAPGWMSGTHPLVSQGIVTRTVCYHWWSSCCQWSNTIRVRNCGSFYVYYLQSPPACWLRYCTAKGRNTLRLFSKSTNNILTLSNNKRSTTSYCELLGS